MSTGLHKDLDIAELHRVQSLTFADATARLAYSPTASDVGRICQQLDSLTFYILEDDDPITWVSLGHATGVGISAGQVIFNARKGSAGTIPKGAPVYVSGFNVGGWIEVEAAQANAAGTMPALGLANTALTDSSTGEVLALGSLANVDTSSWAVHAAVYVSAASPGVLTNVKPTGATNLIQKVAEVTRSHATEGTLQVFGAGRSNDIPNLADGNIWKGDASGVAQSVAFAHTASHQSGGSDAIKLDDLAAPDDNTDLDASTAKHGLLKKLDGSTEKYLRGDGAWDNRPVFGRDYQRQGVVARSTTTGENTVQVTLTTGALTGTYRIGFGCIIDANNKVTVETLYNSTDAAVLWLARPKPPTVNDVDFPFSGAVELVLTGTSKTLQLRYGNAPGQTDVIGIQYAYIEMWRVS